MVLNVHRNRKVYQGRGEGGKGAWRGWGRLCTYRYTVTTSMTHVLRWVALRAVLMFHELRGTKSEDSAHKPQLLKRKETPKRIRTEVPPLTSLTPYR